ncbi:AgmX/PglI C-terminal domain-containing protein [Bermanella sp. R86510]|uniref:AgmX/PglI C-terminal domain-containing protein n=1 Tax=unclassified Bermanella TaxID=2627862 RepID=UPI0037CB0235
MSVAMSQADNHAKVSDHLALDLVLPWHENEEQNEKFKRIAKKVAIPILAFMFVMQLLPSFTGEDQVEEKMVAQVILEPPKVEPDEPPPTEVKEQKTQSINKKPKPKEGAKSGKPDVNALAKQLSALSGSVNLSKAQKRNITTSSEGSVQKSTRSLLGKDSATATSGGLKSSDVTVNARGATLADHRSTEVENPIANIELPSKAEYHYDPDKNKKRDMQSIRRTLERYKGAVYSLYTKALRQNSELNGRFIFEFVILPSGAIDGLKLKSSELGDRQLEGAMLDKIGQINFGAEDVNPTAVQYTFTFLPS